MTTAPAPRFMCPTSELPIWPSGRPTARPHAISCACGYVDHNSSNTGVSASEIALPGPSGAIPQPSRTTRTHSVAGSRRRTGRNRHQARVAASTIAANDSGSSEAPPTSAPSTSGWQSTSSQFSGLTLPP